MRLIQPGGEQDHYRACTGGGLYQVSFTGGSRTIFADGTAHINVHVLIEANNGSFKDQANVSMFVPSNVNRYRVPVAEYAPCQLSQMTSTGQATGQLWVEWNRGGFNPENWKLYVRQGQVFTPLSIRATEAIGTVAPLLNPM